MKSLSWILPILLMALLTPFTPGLDLDIERYFYNDHQFSQNAFYDFVFDYGAVPGELLAILAGLIFLFSYLKKTWKAYRPLAMVIMLPVLIGAGLLVHVVLKDHWGRPRPKQVIEFGGAQEFRPFYYPNIFHQPEPSKSFPCGHCSMGFSWFALVFVGRRLNNRFLINAGWIAAFTFGIVLSVTRMAQGGHFFSDVLMTALIMWLVSYACDYYVFKYVHKRALERGWKVRSDDLCAKIYYTLAKIFRNIKQYSEKFLRVYSRFVAAKHPDHTFQTHS